MIYDNYHITNMIIISLTTKNGLMIYFFSQDQRGGLLDKTMALSTGRSGVRIRGQGKCSLRTIAVHSRVYYPLFYCCNKFKLDSNNTLLVRAYNVFWLFLYAC